MESEASAMLRVLATVSAAATTDEKVGVIVRERVGGNKCGGFCEELNALAVSLHSG